MDTRFSCNKDYLIKNNKPWFPIMGEFHYARYDKRFWEESLYKMKTGGIDVVSTYTFWIHHEEIKGEYDFSGNKDLRSFVETCKSCDLFLFLRVGPWCHGEVRNGGFPDWLINEGPTRINDKEYFEKVEVFYRKVYEQVEGLFLKDGGPIIGIQIENEYGHCGGLIGEEGEEHMRTLTKISKKIGYDVPYYTATGWGGAVTGGLLPVMGGYCEAPWDQRLTEIEPSGNYIFTHERNDHNIGSDYGFGTGITFDISKFPFLTAELGGGLQVTHHRRPIARPKDISAMSLAKLGSGVNLLGYYMYHGGTNPKGKLSSLQETKISGYSNDYPELNYDFQAPIREYGQMSETLKELKLWAQFVKDFGEELCEMPAIIPDSNPLFPKNLEDLRTSFRHDGKKGYVFINNYQRRCKMREHEDVVLEVILENEKILFPSIDIKNEEFFFYPFNMTIGEAILKSATATPLCKLSDSAVDTYVFYTDKDPNYQIEGDLKDIKLITLSRNEAINAWKVKGNRDYLIISEADIVKYKDDINIISRGDATVKVYPELAHIPNDFIRKEDYKGFAVYEKKIVQQEASVQVSLVIDNEREKEYEILLRLTDDIDNCYLRIDYFGDTAELYIDQEMIADHFYTSEVWEVGLKHFNFPNKLRLKINVLEENAPIFLETWPKLRNGKVCKLNHIDLSNEYYYKFNI